MFSYLCWARRIDCTGLYSIYVLYSFIFAIFGLIWYTHFFSNFAICTLISYMRLIRYMGLYLLYSPMFAIFATFSHTRLCLPPSSTWADLFSKWPGRPNRFVRGFVRGYVQLCAGHFAPKYPLGQDGLLSVWPLSTGIDTIENRDLPPCYKLHPCISTLPWGQLCYPHVVPKHATNNTNAEYRPPMWSVLLAICRANAVKKQNKRWTLIHLESLLLPISRANVCKKHYNVEYQPFHEVSFTHISFQCVQKQDKCSIAGPPMESVLLSICRSSACKNQYKYWISTLPWGQFRYPYVSNVRKNVVRMLNIDPPMGLVLLPICRYNVRKKQCNCWTAALPWCQFCYPYVAPTR